VQRCARIEIDRTGLGLQSRPMRRSSLVVVTRNHLFDEIMSESVQQPTSRIFA
jgi:hypothetical protein